MRKQNFILLLVLFSITEITTAQISPAYDPAWQKQTPLCESFDSLGLRASKWSIEDNTPNKVDTTFGFGFIMYKRNISFTGTTIKIKVDTLSNKNNNGDTTIAGIPYDYQGGQIQTEDTSYKYGYLEIYAKYPTGGNGGMPGWGTYHPAFWVWYSVNDCGNHPPVPGWYDEIDIAEQGGDDANEGHTMGTNWHTNLLSNGCYNNFDYYGVTGLPLLSSGFHKYAVEWNPKGIIWYFDDSPVRTGTDTSTSKVPSHHMAALLTFALDYYHPSHGNFPAYFEIDYMNYYTLTPSCGTNLTICTPGTDYSGRAVEKSIVTGGACSPTFNTSDKFTLRSTENVTLDVGTTINPDGSGQFAIQIMGCPQ